MLVFPNSCFQCFAAESSIQSCIVFISHYVDKILFVLHGIASSQAPRNDEEKFDIGNLEFEIFTLSSFQNPYFLVIASPDVLSGRGNPVVLAISLGIASG